MKTKKILIAIDGSENSLRAVHYVGDMLQHTDGVSIKLLAVERLPSHDLIPDEALWKDKCTELKNDAMAFLNAAKEALVSQNIAEEKIEIEYLQHCLSPLCDPEKKRCSRGTSIALEILRVLESEGFDTVVVGRRGVSKAEEFLFGSVSSKIVHNAKYCTVWVVS